MRQPKPESMQCPYCGEEVEVWSDEIRATCSKCGRAVMREGNMSCLEWCAYAERCVGDTIYQDYMAKRSVGIKTRLLAYVDQLYDRDPRSKHAREVLSIAEQLAKEEQADHNIVVPVAILHEADSKAARRALLELGFRMEHIEEACRLVGCLKEGTDGQCINFDVVRDADRLVGIGAGSGREGEFLTRAGSEAAQASRTRA